jgi:Winged helix DNA-binding domain
VGAAHARSIALRADGRAPWSYTGNYRVVAPARCQRERTIARRCAAWCALPELERFEGPTGTTLYDLPGAPRPGEDVGAPPRLLPMWDNTLLAVFRPYDHWWDKEMPRAEVRILPG